MSAIAWACPLTDSQVQEHLMRLQSSWAQGQSESLSSSLRSLERELSCLEEPLSRETAQLWHQLQAAQALESGELSLAAGALRSSMSSPALAGDLPGLEDPSHWLLVDGSRQQLLPRHRSYLLQEMSPEGELLRTEWVPQAQQTLRREERESRLVWWASSAGLALMSGGCYLLAARRADSFMDLATPSGELDALRRENRTMVISSAALGLGAASLGVVAHWGGRSGD